MMFGIKHKKIFWIAVIVLVIFLLAGTGFYLYNKILSDNYFTIVVLPDTQSYSNKYPQILKSQTKWIADNIKKENIVFAVNEGDIVNNFDDEKQWQNAKQAFDTLKGKLPYGLLLGNHDMDLNRQSAMFEKYFPFSERKNLYPQQQDYPAGTGYNSYQLFDAGKEKYISVDLSFCPTNDVVTWANGILKNYSDRKAIIVTHGYLNTDASRKISVPQDKKGGCTDSKSPAKYIWDKIIYPNGNVFLVLCGHMHGENMRIDKNVAGKNVYQLLADYQARENGGNGLMRVLQFDLLTGKIHIRTYSPYSDKYETDENSDFVLNLKDN